jgi:glycosyltransferase involved in cell wall biosynthesis
MTRRRLMIVLDDPQLPSSRVSALQFTGLLRDAGYDVDVAALRAPELLQRQERVRHYAARLRVRRAAEPFVARMQRQHEADLMERAARAEVIYVIKAPQPELLARISELSRPKLIFHVSDAFWLPFLQEHGWREMEPLLALPDAITTTNEYTASHVRLRNPSVHVVPDCPQVEDFDALRGSVQRDRDHIVVGWIGTPLTATSLFKIWEPLEQLAEERKNWSLRLVGAGFPNLINVPRFENVRWSSLPGYDQETMIREVLAMDIGIFPLFAGDDALARGSLKALIYMSGEAATVSQAYGDNVDTIVDGVTGFLAGGNDQWLDKLRRLIDDGETRRTMAANGLQMVRERYSRAKVFEQLRRAIESV